MNKYLLILIGLSLLLLSCFPMINTFETAQSTRANSLALGSSLSPGYFSMTQEDGFHLGLWPMSRLTLKYGMTDDFDIGLGTYLAFWIPGVILNAKYQFLKNDIDGAFFIDNTYYAFNLTNSGEHYQYKIYNLRPNFIISQESKGKFPYSIALGLHYWLVNSQHTENSNSSSMISLTTNFGLPLRFGHNRSLKIMPEIGLWVPIHGSASIISQSETHFYNTGNVFGQFGIYLGK